MLFVIVLFFGPLDPAHITKHSSCLLRTEELIKMLRFMLEGPRPCSIFCFALISKEQTKMPRFMFSGRSSTLHNLLFCPYTLCMNYVTNTVAFISRARPTVNLPCISPENSVTCNGEYRRPFIKAQPSFHDVEVDGGY